MLETALRYSHTLLKEIVTTGDVVVDATMGNGNDTAYLASLVGSSGQVHAFDIQQSALDATKERLEREQLTKQVTLHLEGHEKVGNYLQHNLKTAIFNLGYLPTGDKSIITLPKTTLLAIESLLEHLLPKGRIILVVYYGHEGGEIEKNAISDYVQGLSQELFSVLQYQFINQKNQPPFLFCIEKKKLKD
ncbi:MAG: methyltransferase domain-containing protein [Lactobacillales bacterium]|jgi:16S rRNA C1402 N4-methylase RsmH|nr:methyltransferase domain-containing protein [Lactobacillales bacterium]